MAAYNCRNRHRNSSRENGTTFVRFNITLQRIVFYWRLANYANNLSHFVNGIFPDEKSTGPQDLGIPGNIPPRGVYPRPRETHKNLRSLLLQVSSSPGECRTRSFSTVAIEP
ncbi:uncharacterized protein [Macrobrachium rosenbergii]|uniref:uncharacterized protein isoform X2 n=1 Tax=Macrobrachium rosenbergii TaxID=79674 RepID=UPI0034D573C9